MARKARIEFPHLRKPQWIRQLFLHGGLDVLASDRRALHWDDAANALSRTAGRFWDTQDQRNTTRTRFRYLFTPRLWAAIGTEYGSGLPVAFEGTIDQATAHMVRRLSSALISRATA